MENRTGSPLFSVITIRLVVSVGGLFQATCTNRTPKLLLSKNFWIKSNFEKLIITDQYRRLYTIARMANTVLATLS